jgi:hypothetical protein
MRRFKSNRYLVIASLSAFVYFGVGHFVNLPDIVEGFCVGLCIVFYLKGLFDFSKVQSLKKNLIRGFIK